MTAHQSTDHFDVDYGNFLLDFNEETDAFMDLDLVLAVEEIEMILAGNNVPDSVSDVSSAVTSGVNAGTIDDLSVPDRGIKEENTSRLPELDESELEYLVAGKNSKNTDKMTKWGVKVFRQWLETRRENLEFENLSPNALDDLLRRFYAEIRNTNGDLYSKSTFVGIRASINRHLRSPPHNRNVSLLEDRDFVKSNQMFKSMLKKLKREGQDKTEHHPAISDGDLQKLRSSGVFNQDNPRSLQRKVWFDITLRENMRDLKPFFFLFKSDDSGVDYIEMAYNEATKNHQGDDLKDRDFEAKPRMYATMKENCPVASLRLYLEKRNADSNVFFQQPKAEVDQAGPCWYTSRPFGIRALSDMIKTISLEISLSRVYTNHCVRATTITLLSHAGVETREIMRISGHKNEQSIKSYNTDSSDSQKRQYSAIIHGESVAVTEPITSTERSVDLPQSITQHRMPFSGLKQLEVYNSQVNVYNYFGGQ